MALKTGRMTCPAAVIDLIKTLITCRNVQSVSFPFPDEHVWRVLVAEQIARTHRTGLHPQHAFGLSGPDCGLDFDTAAWGGYVHIPYEGICEGDLIVKPEWCGCNLQAAMADGDLTSAMYGKRCHHLLLKGVHDDVDSAARTVADGWTLYASKRPYFPCSPFLKMQFDPDEPLPSPWSEPI